MATVSSAPLTLEEFSRLPGDGARHEMNAGELITLPPPKSAHSRLARFVFLALNDFVQREGASEVYQETGYILSHEPLTIRQPDVSVLSTARVQATPEDSYFEGAPELAVEILSPSDTVEALQAKVEQYLQTGATQVWVLSPKTQEVFVYQSQRTLVLNSNQVLEGGDLLPGFSIRVSDLFSGSHATA